LSRPETFSMTRPSTPPSASPPDIAPLPHDERTGFAQERAADDPAAAPVTIRRLAGSVEPVRRAVYVRRDTSRPGEADRVELLALTPGVELAWPAAGLDAATVGGRAVEWLVLSGEVRVDGERLVAEDFLRHPLRASGHRVEALAPARLYARLGPPERGQAPGRVLAHAAEARWRGAAGAAQCRVLWADEREAALLVRAPAGLGIAARRHRVDEERLVLEGELAVGDIVLRAGDLQVAPAGGTRPAMRVVAELRAWLRGDAGDELVVQEA
jgi:hypothetical protein